MNTMSHKAQGATLNLEKVREIFTMSSRIADDTESVLEDNIAFSSDFMRGLNKSLGDARKGKIKKISSLRDILS
jgi:hypothetical protein